MMGPLSVGDVVVRKVNHLDKGMWTYLCNKASRNPSAAQTVVRISYTTDAQFVKLEGIAGSYCSANFAKVNDV